MRKMLRSGMRGGSFVESLLLVSVVALAGIGAFRKLSNGVGETSTKQGERVLAMQGSNASGKALLPGLAPAPNAGAGNAVAGGQVASVPATLKLPPGQSPILAQVAVPKGAGNPIGAFDVSASVQAGVDMAKSERESGASRIDAIGAGALSAASTLGTGVDAFAGLSMASRRRITIEKGKFRHMRYDPQTGLVYTMRGDPVDVNGVTIGPWWSRWATGAVDEQAVYKPPTKP